MAFFASVWQGVVSWLFVRHEPDAAHAGEFDVPDREWTFGLWRWLLYVAAVAVVVGFVILFVVLVTQ
jgi:hypothetical protein